MSAFGVREPAETRPNGPPVAILSDEVWRSSFGANPSILDSKIEINGVRRTIVGIMPPHFDVADQRAEVWLPLVIDPANRRNRGSHFLYLIGRLADGATLDSAKAELGALLDAWPASIARPGRATGGPHTPNNGGTGAGGRDRLLAQLLGLFAGLALLLAAIGSYDVLAYMVTERRREIGIRMALGADRASVLRMVLGQGLRLTVVGVSFGLAVAFAINRVLASRLFGVKPGDPMTVGAVVALMAAVAILACYLPARSATRVDPMIVLREE